ncbi:Rossmann-like and DUF2520 domain-containing protein [Longimonas halophila]|nr:Rossmann-like and DUF2520 domain-containing protein [Longimonas halophila]
MSTLVRKPTAIVGAGAVGTAFARALAAHRIPLTAIVSRTQADAKALADRVQAPQASTDVADVPARTTRVLFCVPDDALSSVAHTLAETPHRTAPWIAFHPSGAHPAEVLAPLRACGARLLSAHPLQTIPPGTPPSAFQGIQMTIEGDAEALTYGEALARLLGALPQRLASADKPLYHLAAVLASNGLVALLTTAQHVWQAAGLDPDDAFAALAPLIDTTWANVQRNGPAALTGPAARGDDATIDTHLRALRQTCTSESLSPLLDDASAEALYAALTETMLRIQQSQDRLSDDAAARVRARLRSARTPDLSGNDTAST